MLNIDDLRLPSPILSITQEGLALRIKRDDLIHPIISGNKWRKLKYNLLDFQGKGIISFGGPFSNHLHALSYFCHQLNIPFMALIRGDQSYLENPTLEDLLLWNTKVEFLTSQDYRMRHSKDFMERLQQEYPEHSIIPEGGTNIRAQKGIEELSDEILTQFPEVKHLFLPVASGGTMAGLINALPSDVRIYGISIQKETYMEETVTKWLISPKNNWEIIRSYHFGGLGRCPIQLRDFMKKQFYDHQLPLDPMYNAKALFGALDIIKTQPKIPHHEALYLHTGGLQGIRGYQHLYPGTLEWF